ncbi:MAG: hypothetical protein K0S67_12 [Nitrososphaeraceae archaeon]|jgi:hypothetical protein|nr:hypothetical protein [Nitrososphaeraceae archaeon]
MEYKTCIKCENKLPLDKFYKAGKYYQSSCIECYNGFRIDQRTSLSYITPNKKKGFDALSEDKKEYLLELICYKCDLVEISKLTGIYYRTLIYWKNKGWIPTYQEYFGK